MSDSSGHVSIGCTAATLKGTGKKGDSRAMSLSKLQDIVNDREAWWASVLGVTKIGHDLVTEQEGRSLSSFETV